VKKTPEQKRQYRAALEKATDVDPTLARGIDQIFSEHKATTKSTAILPQLIHRIRQVPNYIIGERARDAGKSRGAQMSAEAALRHAEWQRRANEAWKGNSHLSTSVVAKIIEKEVSGSTWHTIRQVIKNPHKVDD